MNWQRSLSLSLPGKQLDKTQGFLYLLGQNMPQQQAIPGGHNSNSSRRVIILVGSTPAARRGFFFSLDGSLSEEAAHRGAPNNIYGFFLCWPCVQR